MKIRTKAVSLLLTVLLVFGVYAIVPPAAFAEEIIEVTAETDYFTDGNTYRVSQDVTNDKRIRMQGSAVLTLDEGVTLTLNKGIQVSENNSLTIRGAGKLIANAEKNNAAIGSGESQKNGAITIESGEIIATGGEFAAGIFDRTNRKEAGYSFRVFGTDQPMSINCFADSAFDPSPDNDKYLLNKKSVTRLGVQKPIAIDGNISNGTLSADKEFAAAGETVTLDVQPDENYEIGEAGFTDGSGYHKITPEDGVYSFTMPNSSVTAKASFNKITYPYVDAHGRARGPVSEYEVVKKDTTELTEGFWIVNSNVTNKNRLTVNGNVKLILCDGAELTAPEGITVNYDDENENTNLTIFGQSAGTGRLTIEKPTTVRRTPL